MIEARKSLDRIGIFIRWIEGNPPLLIAEHTNYDFSSLAGCKDTADRCVSTEGGAEIDWSRLDQSKRIRLCVC